MSQLRELESPGATLARTEYPSFDADSAGFSLEDLLSILKRHRTLFLTVFLGVCALGALYILGSHKKYTSMMELLVQNGRSAVVLSAGRQEASASPEQVTEEELGSEVQLMESADVLDEVIDPGWSNTPKDKHPAADLARHEQQVDALRKNLIVAPVKLSHVFTVQVTTRSPYDSNAQLMRMLNAFLAEKRMISHPSGASAMFEQQADSYRQQWQDAEGQLTAFQQGKQLVTVSGQQDLIEKEILSIDSQLRDSDVAISEAQKKIDGDRGQISVLPGRLSTRETNIPAVAAADQMYTKLSDLRIQRTELLAKYQPTDRLVRQVDDKIKEIQASLDESRTIRSSETTTDINPTFQAAQMDLSETTAKLNGLKGREAALRAQLADLRSSLSSVTAGTQSFGLLQHKVAELEANYQLYAQKRDEAKMAEVMDEHQLLNVAVIQAPTFSPNPVSPKPFIDSLITLITAFFVASFAVFLVHNSSSTVVTERELQAISRYPILASVPVRRGLQGRQGTA